jgi:hypothetical protein
MVYTRSDLIKNFPTRFSQSEIIRHFHSEYVKLVGCPAPSRCIETAAKTFVTEWKKYRNKELFMNSSSCKRWLEKELIMPDNVDAAEVTPVRKEVIRRKPFEGCCTNFLNF